MSLWSSGLDSFVTIFLINLAMRELQLEVGVLLEDMDLIRRNTVFFYF